MLARERHRHRPGGSLPRAHRRHQGHGRRVDLRPHRGRRLRRVRPHRRRLGDALRPRAGHHRLPAPVRPQRGHAGPADHEQHRHPLRLHLGRHEPADAAHGPQLLGRRRRRHGRDVERRSHLRGGRRAAHGPQHGGARGRLRRHDGRLHAEHAPARRGGGLGRGHRPGGVRRERHDARHGGAREHRGGVLEHPLPGRSGRGRGRGGRGEQRPHALRGPRSGHDRRPDPRARHRLRPLVHGRHRRHPDDAAQPRQRLGLRAALAALHRGGRRRHDRRQPQLRGRPRQQPRRGHRDPPARAPHGRDGCLVAPNGTLALIGGQHTDATGTPALSVELFAP